MAVCRARWQRVPRHRARRAHPRRAHRERPTSDAAAREAMRSLYAALAEMHRCGLVLARHSPSNWMRFNGEWKLLGAAHLRPHGQLATHRVAQPPQPQAPMAAAATPTPPATFLRRSMPPPSSRAERAPPSGCRSDGATPIRGCMDRHPALARDDSQRAHHGGTLRRLPPRHQSDRLTAPNPAWHPIAPFLRWLSDESGPHSSSHRHYLPQRTAHRLSTRLRAPCFNASPHAARQPWRPWRCNCRREAVLTSSRRSPFKRAHAAHGTTRITISSS